MSDTQLRMETRTLDVRLERDENLGENSFRGIISNGSVDRYKTRFLPEGGDVTGFMKNPIVFFKHERYMLPIGRCTELTMENGEWHAAFEIDGETEFERLLVKKMNKGSINGLSIGARIDPSQAVEEGGIVTFRKWELFEFSVVDVPGNSDAVITARNAPDEDALMRALVEEGEVKRLMEEHLEQKPDVEARQGKVLSRANEEKLRQALKAIQEVLGDAGDEGEEKEAEEEDVEDEEDADRALPVLSEEEVSTQRNYLEQLYWELENRDLEPMSPLEALLEDFEF